MVHTGKETAMIISRCIRIAVCVFAAVTAMMAEARADDANDYPTNARVEYVFGCMKANGETRQTIDRCPRLPAAL
jgi:hypothetical protein